jgi:hypothetical protein
LSRKYINTHAGATARKTVPTNLARKLEKRIISFRHGLGFGNSSPSHWNRPREFVFLT